MLQLRASRTDGVGLLAVLLPITLVLTVAMGVSALAAVNLRATARNWVQTRAFYIADSGAQIGNALLRSTGPAMMETQLSETIHGGVASVVVSPLGSDLFRITSTGTLEEFVETVVMHVEFSPAGTAVLDGSLEVNLNRSVAVDTDIPVWLDGSGTLSGLDHAPDGTLLADQSLALPGLAINPLPNSKDFTAILTGAPVFEGSPTLTVNDAEGHAEFLTALRDHALNNADVLVGGSTFLGAAERLSGVYGTQADPKLVFVSLGTDETLTMREDFEGHGTLVIDVGNAVSASPLVMEEMATWYGLVLLNFKAKAEVPGGALIELNNSSTVLGGIGVLVTSKSAKIPGNGNLMNVAGMARVLFSSQLASTSKGVSDIPASQLAKLKSYERH